ncbi:hypothetical protein [Aquipseudomonas alcaligenes]|uniref:Uncharacterized protein n=1 Tax=Aquipseudomonas alcaligenes TaxID=43263 RepID=A0A1N6S7P9_AQUAC|nr:hypothetical protein [Pseudomonas alcaligenes]SIQ37124.1 hypothetical protein SAMN05878282_103413 [Pseudomonas alcaligenes]
MATLKVSAPFNYREGTQTLHYKPGPYEVAERCSEKTISQAGVAHAVKIKAGELEPEKAPSKPAARPATPAE